VAAARAKVRAFRKRRGYIRTAGPTEWGDLPRRAPVKIRRPKEAAIPAPLAPPLEPAGRLPVKGCSVPDCDLRTA